jgi:hypothetical protein
MPFFRKTHRQVTLPDKTTETIDRWFGRPEPADLPAALADDTAAQLQDYRNDLANLEAERDSLRQGLAALDDAIDVMNISISAISDLNAALESKILRTPKLPPA